MIASKTGGSVELIEDKVNGFLVERDGEELEQIISCIQDNYHCLKKMQNKAYEFAIGFTRSKCSKALSENIEELVN